MLLRHRRVFVQSLFCLSLVALASCNREHKRTVGVIPKGRTHIFWQSVHAGAVKAGRERGAEIRFNGPQVETDTAGQVQIMDNMISSRMDAIVVAPVERKGLVHTVERAMAANIPVVIFDSGIETENYVSFVATDNFHAGEVAAQRMGDLLGGKGKVAIVAVQPGSASTMAREEGFEKYTKAHFPNIQIVDKRYGMAEVAQSLNVSENMLSAFPDLDALFASNESSTMGAMQALKGRHSKVKCVGFDWSPSLKADLESGALDSLVVQNPFEMGYQSVLAAIDKLEGKPVAKNHPLEPHLVRRDDLSKPEIQQLLNPDLKKYLD